MSGPVSGSRLPRVMASVSPSYPMPNAGVPDYFSPGLSELFVRGAAVFGAIAGAIELFLGLRAPGGVAMWAVAEGLVVMALAYGVWRYSLVCAVALLVLKLAGVVLTTLQAGSSPSIGVIVQVLFYLLAAAAIKLGGATRRPRTVGATTGPLPKKRREEGPG